MPGLFSIKSDEEIKTVDGKRSQELPTKVEDKSEDNPFSGENRIIKTQTDFLKFLQFIDEHEMMHHIESNKSRKCGTERVGKKQKIDD